MHVYTTAHQLDYWPCCILQVKEARNHTTCILTSRTIPRAKNELFFKYVANRMFGLGQKKQHTCKQNKQ